MSQLQRRNIFQTTKSGSELLSLQKLWDSDLPTKNVRGEKGNGRDASPHVIHDFNRRIERLLCRTTSQTSYGHGTNLRNRSSHNYNFGIHRHLQRKHGNNKRKLSKRVQRSYHPRNHSTNIQCPLRSQLHHRHIHRIQKILTAQNTKHFIKLWKFSNFLFSFLVLNYRFKKNGFK